VTAFGKQAETLARYLRKGSRLCVQGRLTFSPWLNRNGEPQVSADVLLQEFQFVPGGRRDDNGNVSAIDAESAVIPPGEIQDVTGHVSAANIQSPTCDSRAALENRKRDQDGAPHTSLASAALG
jgi:single-stranded DNA-binding protein